jgi:GGDEF domain-containing protein
MYCVTPQRASRWRSASLLMQELTLTRSELSRISQTDQLAQLLNRRGFDDAATLALRSRIMPACRL